MNTIWFYIGLPGRGVIQDVGFMFKSFYNDILLHNRMWCKICDVKHKKTAKD